MKNYVKEVMSAVALALAVVICMAPIVGCCDGTFGYHSDYGFYLRRQNVSTDNYDIIAGVTQYEYANLNWIDMIDISIKNFFAI